MYICGIIAAITLESLPKKSLSSETTPDILSDYSSIMYSCGVVLLNRGVLRQDIQGIGAAIQDMQQVILVTTTNLRIKNNNVKLFRHNL